MLIHMCYYACIFHVLFTEHIVHYVRILQSFCYDKINLITLKSGHGFNKDALMYVITYVFTLTVCSTGCAVTTSRSQV